MSKVVVKQKYDGKFKPLLERIKERVMNVGRRKEKGIINKASNSSIAIRSNGGINISSSNHSQQKMHADGKNTIISAESETLTNVKKITADEIIINGHKLNMKLIEYTDLKPILGHEDKLITNLAMTSTVLVKAWEPTLERYVMVRRPARFSLFSPELNTAEIHPNLGISSDLSSEFEDTMDIEAAANSFNEFSQAK